MAGVFCRGCGKNRDELGVADARKCPQCAPLKPAQRRFCEFCGARWSPSWGTHVCDPALKKQAGGSSRTASTGIRRATASSGSRAVPRSAAPSTYSRPPEPAIVLPPSPAALAFAALESRAESGDGAAMLELAEWYCQGRSPVATSQQKAWQWLAKAEAAGATGASEELTNFTRACRIAGRKPEAS